METTLRSAGRARASCEVLFVDERKVASANAGVPDDRALGNIADLFGALSDRTRLRILFALSREELCVCDVARIARRSIPAVSHHLALLRRLRLVTYRNEGKLAYYRLDSEAAQQLLRDAARRERRGRRS